MSCIYTINPVLKRINYNFTRNTDVNSLSDPNLL